MKIICKFHDDQNASMEVYDNETETVGFCYVCSARVVLDGKPSGRRRKPTDLPSELNRINNLPHEVIRGFNMPLDDLGFYLLWPSRDFYKRRNFHDNPRYTAPRGIKAPLYKFQGTTKTCIIVEGELNARSLYESLNTKDTVMSPGSVANLSSCLKVAQLYDNIVLVVDHDPAGIVYGTTLKNKLLSLGKRCILITCPVDYNELYCTKGPEAVRQHFEENL